MPTNNIRQLVSYTPKLDGNKWVTDVTTGKFNGGIYRQEEFKKGVEMLLDCAHNLPNPRLFHVCLTGADVPIYQLVIKRLCRALKAQDVVTRYRGAIEHDETKGEHCHLYIVLSSIDKQTARFITCVNEEKREVLNYSTLWNVINHTLTECPTLKYRVNVPKVPNRNPLHDNKPAKTVSFLQFNQTNQPFFDNVVEWMSYAYKVRSKKAGTCYLSDRHNKPSSLAKASVKVHLDNIDMPINSVNLAQLIEAIPTCRSDLANACYLSDRHNKQSTLAKAPVKVHLDNIDMPINPWVQLLEAIPAC